MRRVPAAVLVALLVVLVGVAVAATGGDESSGSPAPWIPAVPAAADPDLPEPDARVPRGPRGLARELTTTIRALRGAVERWREDGDPSEGRPPREVTLLALYHQRLLRVASTERRLGDRAIARLPDDVRGEARDIVHARRAIAAIPTGGAKPPPLRVAAPEPAGLLREAYRDAWRRFGVGWHVLAAVNLVESAYGRVRSASSAGARGPMQFLPSTWRQYGMGGDIDDAGDAIMGAANYLSASGAPQRYRKALFAYNRSRSYVSAILNFARRMKKDERVYYALYAWQVYARGPDGVVRRLTGPR